MKVLFLTSDLVEALASATRVTASKSAIVALSGVKLEARDGGVFLRATDRETAISQSVPCTVEEDGDVLLPGTLLLEIARAFPESGTTTIATKDDGRVRVSSGRSRTDVHTLRLDHFPPLPHEPITQYCAKLPARPFVRGLKRVIVAASKDGARPQLGGVLIDAAGSTLTLAATDAYRLAVQESQLATPIEGEFKAIIPTAVLGEIARLAANVDEIGVAFQSGQAVFAIGSGVMLSSRVIDAEFPPYADILPTEFSATASVDRAHLQSVVRQVALIVPPGATLRLDFAEGNLAVSAWEAGVGKAYAEASLDYEGDPLSIGVNSVYLRDGLDCADSDTITVQLTTAMKPTLISTTDASGFRYLLMPVRLPDNQVRDEEEVTA